MGFLLCSGRCRAVVKYRHEAGWKAWHEECHFVLASLMGCHVVAPCLAVDLDVECEPGSILERPGLRREAS